MKIILRLFAEGTALTVLPGYRYQTWTNWGWNNIFRMQVTSITPDYETWDASCNGSIR